jgi:sulfhydrogenase subunit beta (sulfur reductase)
MKAVTEKELGKFFESLSSEYDVRVPVSLKDGSRTLGRLEEGPLALEGGYVPFKPTSVFFPQFEKIFETGNGNGKIKMAEKLEKPLLVVGMTAQDLDCLEFIDKFFSSNYVDDLYFNKRNNSVVVGVSGKAGKDGEFMKIAGGKCDIELVFDGERYNVVPYSEIGKSLLARMDGGVESSSVDNLKRESDALSKEDMDTISRASELLLQDKVPDEFWEEIASRCIVCTSCNLSCPTCTCFDVKDRKYENSVERIRIWDSCQYDGFMREASMHNPMGTEAQRTRRRIHHKLAADPTRWQTKTCFLCGRCDDVCPTNIGMLSVSREIVARYG